MPQGPFAGIGTGLLAGLPGVGRQKPWLPARDCYTGCTLHGSGVDSANGTVCGRTWHSCPWYVPDAAMTFSWFLGAQSQGLAARISSPSPVPSLLASSDPRAVMIYGHGCQGSARAVVGRLARSVTSRCLGLVWTPRACLHMVFCGPQGTGRFSGLPEGGRPCPWPISRLCTVVDLTASVVCPEDSLVIYPKKLFTAWPMTSCSWRADLPGSGFTFCRSVLCLRTWDSCDMAEIC